MATPAAVLSILVKAQGVQATSAQLGALDKSARTAGAGLETTERHAKRSSRTFSALGTAAKTAGPLIGAVGLAAGVKTAVGEFREAQKVGAQTNAVLKSTGRQAGVTKKHIEDLAGSISRKSGIDDEAIQSSANLLLTFTKVRNETGRGNKIFDQATQTITDMSVALGQSGKSSAIQLGKALNDPIKGITALRRVGVSFTADQEKQIKAMVTSGNLLGAQKRILKELKTEFGGSAAAQATAGDKLKVSLGNLAEVAGSFLVPQLDKGAKALSNLINDFVEGKGIAKVIIPVFFQVKDAIASVIPVVTQIVHWFGEHRKIAIALVAALGLAFAPLTTWAVLAVVAYKKSQLFRDAVQAVVAVVLAMPAAVTGAFNSVKTTVIGVMNAVSTEIGKWTVLKAVVGAAVLGIVTVVKAALQLVAPVFTAVFGVIKAIVTGAFNAMKAIVSGALQVIHGVIQVFGGIFKGDFGQIWEGVKNIFRGVGTALAGILRASLGTVRDAGIAMGKGMIGGLKSALNLAHTLAEAMRDLISKAPGFALGVGKAIVNGIIAGIKSAASGIGDAVKGALKGAASAANPFGEGLGKKIGIVPMKAPGSLMGARPSLAPFAAVGAANGLHVSSGLRRGATTSSGNTSYHSTGEAVDLAGAPAGMLKTFKTLRSRFGSRLAELIHTPGGAGIKDGKPFVYTGKVARDHFDHVHVAFDTGIPGVGDGLGKARTAGAFIGDGLGSNAKTIWNFLTSKGFTPAQAAGIIGALQQESGLSTTITNKKSGAFGLGQWLGDRKSALMNRKNPSSLQTQLAFLWSELQGPESGALKRIKGAHTISDAAAAWTWGFERPGKAEANMPARIANARSAFSAFKGSGGGGGGSGGASVDIPALKKQISQNLDKLDKLRSQVRNLPGGKKGAGKRRALQDQISDLLAKNRHIRERISGAPATEKVSKFEMAQAMADVALASAASTPAVADDILANTTLRNATTSRIKQVRKTLKKKNLQPATRLRLTQELGGLVGKHTELQSTLKGLRKLDPLTGKEMPTLQDIVSENAGNVASALNMVALKERAGMLSPADAEAQSAGIRNSALAGGFGQLAPEDWLQIAGDLKDAAEEARKAAEAQAEHTAALKALTDAIAAQNAIATSTIGIGLREAQRALADMISGQLGGYAGTAGRALTAGSGTVVRY